MKTRFCTALALLLFACSSHAADEQSLGFLQPEHRYHFIYPTDQNNRKFDLLPANVVVVSHAGASWYVVKPDNSDTHYWINLNSVAAITELQK